MTPASESTPDPSAMTTSSGSRVRVTSSRVSSFSPFSARRTTSVSPVIRAASKACIGCPNSIIT